MRILFLNVFYPLRSDIAVAMVLAADTVTARTAHQSFSKTLAVKFQTLRTSAVTALFAGLFLIIVGPFKGNFAVFDQTPHFWLVLDWLLDESQRRHLMAEGLAKATIKVWEKQELIVRMRAVDFTLRQTDLRIERQSILFIAVLKQVV